MSIVPWKMCRSCHRIGHPSRPLKQEAKHKYCIAQVMTVAKLPCGQCTKRRHLVECHMYDFRGKKGRRIEL